MPEGPITNRSRILGFTDLGALRTTQTPRIATPKAVKCITCDGPVQNAADPRCVPCDAEARERARKAVGL